MQIKCKTCVWDLKEGHEAPCCECGFGYNMWEAKNKSAIPTCPFCGGESELKSYKDSRTEAYWLKCKAYCPGEQNHGTPEAAIEAYGRRA